MKPEVDYSIKAAHISGKYALLAATVGALVGAIAGGVITYNISRNSIEDKLYTDYNNLMKQYSELETLNTTLELNLNSAENELITAHDRIKILESNKIDLENQLGVKEKEFSELVEASVDYPNIKVYLDGKTAKLEDTYGNSAKPISFNGNFYLPISGIENLVGKPISWDANALILRIGGESASSNNIGKVPISNAFHLSGHDYQYLNDVEVDNWGNSHPSAGNASGSEYSLKQEYSNLYGCFFLPYSNRNHGLTGILKIFGDGKLIYTSPMITSKSEAVYFNVDVSNVDILTFDPYDSTSSVHFRISELYLSPK